MSDEGATIPARDKRPPLLSVVIPTRNRRALLEAALGGLSVQSLPAEQYEVIIVIDGSQDGTLEAVQSFPATFELRAIGSGGNGRAAACNAGIAEARGAIVVLLDDDMVATPGLLEAHLQAHDGCDRCAVMGPVPIVDGRDTSPVTRYMADRFDRHMAQLMAGRRIGFRDLYTGNFSIRRALFRDVGAFDEEFTKYGNEDGELGVRLLDAGAELVFAARAIAHQTYDKSLPALVRDSVAKGGTAIILARKHPHAALGLRFSQRASRRKRLFRTVFILMSDTWSGTPDVTTRALDRLGRRWPAVARRLYPAVLDAFYWFGATTERRRTQ